MMIAVPVSWQLGNTMPADTQAFWSIVRATKRSFSVDSGSSSTFRSCARCDGRNRCEMSRIDSAASSVSAWRSTSRILEPWYSPTPTKSSVSLRYGVSPLSSGNISWNWNSGMAKPYERPSAGKFGASPLERPRRSDRMAFLARFGWRHRVGSAPTAADPSNRTPGRGCSAAVPVLDRASRGRGRRHRPRSAPLPVDRNRSSRTRRRARRPSRQGPSSRSRPGRCRRSETRVRLDASAAPGRSRSGSGGRSVGPAVVHRPAERGVKRVGVESGRARSPEPDPRRRDRSTPRSASSRT